MHICFKKICEVWTYTFNASILYYLNIIFPLSGEVYGHWGWAEGGWSEPADTGGK